MIEMFSTIVSITGYAIEALGVSIIAIGFVVASYRVLAGATEAGPAGRFESYRRELGRCMLLGLEFLVAGDIVRTVVVDNSTQSILALGLIVLIRTVLVFTIHLEVNGYWPWQSRQAKN